MLPPSQFFAMLPNPSSKPDPNLFAVILAGGHGERFWPLSRKARPKHHLALLSEHTLLESTLNRLTGLVDPSRILVLTGIDQAQAIRKILSNLPPENLVVEPERRDTAAAMALAAGIIASRNPQATAIVLPSDHHIPSPTSFQATLQNTVHVARASNSIVTVAIQPDWPCPGFGYLELGSPEETQGFPFRKVLRFHEKPTSTVATEYLARGNFRWNAGMFVWTVSALQSALQRTAPDLAAFATDLSHSKNLEAFLEERFSKVPKISFDFAVMEKLPDALAVDAGFEWDDLGGWTAAGKYFPKDASNNASNLPIQTKDASGNIVFSSQSGQHIALLGVENLIVVNTGDALFICPKDQAERLKEVVAELPDSLK